MKGNLYPLLPEQMTREELVNEIIFLHDYIKHCENYGEKVSHQMMDRIIKCRSQLMKIVYTVDSDEQPISKLQIKFGVIHSQIVTYWENESEPLFELSDEDQFNNDFPKKPQGRIFNACGFLAEQNKHGIIMIKKSPFYTFGDPINSNPEYASIKLQPNQHEKDLVRCYCLSPQFYDLYRIPHDIYSCETDKLVHKNKWVRITS